MVTVIDMNHEFSDEQIAKAYRDFYGEEASNVTKMIRYVRFVLRYGDDRRPIDFLNNIIINMFDDCDENFDTE